MRRRQEQRPVPRRCEACGYSRYADEVPYAKERSLTDFPLPGIFTSRWRLREWQKGSEYRRYARCPACGSDRVVTVKEEGFVPSAAAGREALKRLETTNESAVRRIEAARQEVAERLAQTQRDLQDRMKAAMQGATPSAETLVVCPACSTKNRPPRHQHGQLRCGKCKTVMPFVTRPPSPNQ